LKSAKADEVVVDRGDRGGHYQPQHDQRHVRAQYRDGIEDHADDDVGYRCHGFVDEGVDARLARLLGSQAPARADQCQECRKQLFHQSRSLKLWF
jgi:hypothetical protein